MRLPFALFLPLGLLFGRELFSTSRRIDLFFCLEEYSRITLELDSTDTEDGSKNEKEGLTLKKIGEKPSWTLKCDKAEKTSVFLNKVTAVWYDKDEHDQKKKKKNFKALSDNDATVIAGEKKDEPLHVVYAVQDLSFEFVAGTCYGIIGSVGSGKSSLLLTILSESRMTRGNLSVNGSFAYCAQEPWIFTGSIQDNIVFGSEFNKERYENALELCLLTPDLRQFANGDMTIVGDNGSTLSGGQRARVALARAVYADADIYLLDDPLSAVDAHVGKKLYEK